ncbi:MAG: DUF3108 domain-containing protein [Acidobacteriota bacterium]|nr:DUF3108 domain-containing protein [Acidobacteriota bacterium]
MFKRSGIAVLIFCMLLTMVVVGLVLASENQSQDLLSNTTDYSVPFEPGERLRYEVKWKPIFLVPAFKAGELTISIKDSHYNGLQAYTLSATTLSGGLLSSVVGLEIRDYFESIIDHTTFKSHKFMRQTRRNTRKRDLEVSFNYEEDSILVHELNTEFEPPLEIRDEIIQGIPGPVSDILSVFYVARLKPLQPGDSYVIYLNSRGKIKPVTIEVQVGETIVTPIGSFNSVKIVTVGGLFSNGGDFHIWYSTDQLRIPIRFEANAKLGKVYGQVIGLETSQMTKSLIEIN